MIKKICKICKKEKNISEFRKHKDTNKKNEIRYYVVWRCKECDKKKWRLVRLKITKAYFKAYPWLNTLNSIRSRCGSVKHPYYIGIKNYLTKDNIKYLWFRDKAYLMKRPSIDRIKRKKHYTIKNCRFLELGDNIRRQFKRRIVHRNKKGQFITGEEK